ncbi:MAG: hypothetical protein LUC38_03160 [Oscillospiraceae bacterium]|nr:hypothetical protein [Oscillospiraceae bacterium]
MKSRKIFALIIAIVMVVQLLPVSISASYSGEDGLSGIDLEVYNELKAVIEDIADGKVSSTVITIEVSCSTASLGVPQITDDRPLEVAVNAFAETLDLNLIISYLIYDCPYELYWIDKRAEVYAEEEFAGMGAELLVTITITLPVSTDYQAGGSSTTVDSAKVSSAKTTAKYAQSIVKKYENYSDEEKIVAFKEAICDLVSYETSYTSSDYGDIWQLVYVFDQDPDTNVVCEGYSKALQYLCDLAGLDCITVSGTMTGATGAGVHMWNVVRLDGVNYLVDVTNSDSGAAGQNGGLFMVCASDAVSSSSSGYSFTAGSKTVTYAYDNLMMQLYPSSYLTLGTVSKAVEEEIEEEHTHTLTKTSAKDATCTTDGNVGYWYCSSCGTYFSDKNATTEISLSNTIIKATGHSYESVVTDPTCTEGGYTTHTCTVCGDTYTDSETAALGHSYESEVTTEPTYFKAGLRTYTCTVCGDSYTEEIETLLNAIEEVVNLIASVCSLVATELVTQGMGAAVKEGVWGVVMRVLGILI